MQEKLQLEKKKVLFFFFNDLSVSIYSSAQTYLPITLLKIQSELELRRERNLQYYRSKLARIDHNAGGARKQIEEKRKYEESVVKEKARNIRSTGNAPLRCFCF